MNCPICNKGNMTERELEMHTKYFHNLDPDKDFINGSSMKSEVELRGRFQQPQKVASGICPECKGTLWYQEGCVNCPSCGFSKCG